MPKKQIPFSDEEIGQWTKDQPTPFYIYDEQAILQTANSLNDAFSWVKEISGKSYRNFFAVKATPTPAIMKLLIDTGMGLDASSGPEIELAKRCGVSGESIMFSSNNTDPEEYKEAHKAGALINLDDINQIDVLQTALDGDLPEFISFRYNPGSQKSEGVNNIIGKPEDAKFGVPDKQLAEAYKKAKELGAKRFGIHTMLASNEVTTEAHVATAELMFKKAAELSEELEIDFELVNLGGGLGIPYRPEQPASNVKAIGQGIREIYEREFSAMNSKPQLATEYGRFVTGPHGYLISKVRSLKDTYHKYVGLDATMANLMRPGMYDAYHHISVVGKEKAEMKKQRVVGSLCENNDFFTGSVTMERNLPEMEVSDIVIIHDAGAHGHAMGFNYNGKLRSAEYLLMGNRSLEQIRRAETRDDIFATIKNF